MDEATCLFCMHPLDGRSKKFCTTCLPPYGQWDDKRGYTNTYNQLIRLCGLHPSWNFPRSPIPWMQPERKTGDTRRNCLNCGETIHMARDSQKRFCTLCRSELASERAKKMHAERAAARPQDWKPSNNAQKNDALRRRRAAHRRSGTKPTVLKLAERDGWRCHICNRKVDPSLTGTKSKYKASVDHLVPLSDGGEDEMWNCKLAHLRCNATRGARGVTQLMIVG